nr:protein NRT1/ PTR FAMILY 8.1-like [Ipomoea batatas]
MGEVHRKDDDLYTKDGTVDYQGNPAKKNETGTWKACPFILGNECCERLAYYGMSTNLVLYFKHKLNQHSATASKNVSNWSGTCYIMPLIGAFLADAFMGRYWTIACFSIIYVIGMALLTLSASVSGLKPTCSKDGVCDPTMAQSAVSFIALYVIALGTGGIKPCVSSFGADQFDDDDEVEKKHKSSFFNWFYFSINIGALIASSVLVWIQDNVGWGWGFGIPAVTMAIAVVSFFSGTRLYRNQKPGGSPLTRICQVLVASIRKYKVAVPAEKSLLYETADAESAITGSRKLDHTQDFGMGINTVDTRLKCRREFFLPSEMQEKFDTTVQVESDEKKDAIDPWRLCTVTQVEELKAIVRLLPIWATGIIFSTVYGQMSTLFVLQGAAMDTRVGNSTFRIPPASLSIFDTLSVIFWVPIYDIIIVPVTRKFTGHKNGLTQLQRMGIGLFISIFGMLSAGILELARLRFVQRHNYYDLEEVPMSIFWQVPQYFLIGCAEVFTFIGQLEFFYEQAPDAMRSLCSALSLTTVALGNYLSSLLVTIVTSITAKDGKPGWIPDNLNRGHIDYFYYLLAILSVLNLGVYLWIAQCLVNGASTSNNAAVATLFAFADTVFLLETKHIADLLPPSGLLRDIEAFTSFNSSGFLGERLGLFNAMIFDRLKDESELDCPEPPELLSSSMMDCICPSMDKLLQSEMVSPPPSIMLSLTDNLGGILGVFLATKKPPSQEALGSSIIILLDFPQTTYQHQQKNLGSVSQDLRPIAFSPISDWLSLKFLFSAYHFL